MIKTLWAVFVVLLGLVLWNVVALAQDGGAACAACPACPPVVNFQGAFAWIMANKGMTISIVLAVVSFVNGLLKHEALPGLLGDLLDRISLLTRSNAPGTLKLPFTKSQPPSQEAKT